MAKKSKPADKSGNSAANEISDNELESLSGGRLSGAQYTQQQQARAEKAGLKRQKQQSKK
ncbi:hypothetical protein Lqui_1911 [Legionella quinlivanii]|uniref:Uncharacterized protein n=1 Tax=Legionella quinlivanii TaxID=45073 RepID=A0A0W0XZF7_9GAMM|nr:hypothetical protein [Legionella quinlivanii]KTD49700.1 hypothetical protein Lqui_1911 [Legionella quinlivanii]MCW8451938.1 hypothetical protein [Legionella quinlivanii]SEG22863.1 hypothetical protein SAMN02746093_02237 [Legionella quinlivanii DSM 21216]STY09865.1 Uncharacterised protein [Legionella quinlivanii]